MAKITKKKTIRYRFGQKHIDYIRKCAQCTINVAEGAVRAGKTVDNVYAFAHELRFTKDRIHLDTGSTVANAKLNIGDANGFGLEYIYRGQSHWGKYKDNDCLYIKGPATGYRQRIVIFAGAAKADSFKKIRGNSYGMWIATEINLHHENTIREAFNRQLAADKRKIFWDLNPDNPKAKIYTDYIDKYAKQEEEGTLIGGYNYQHFTIFDNVTVTKERFQEIMAQYDKNSIWYQRDILGKRMIAEGLIYRAFADAVLSEAETGENRFKRKEKPKNLMEIIIGVDFGGNGSGHAFVATGITRGYQEIIPLASEWHDCSKKDIDPDKLGQLFIDFCLKVLNMYGNITHVYCDSAEQTLINGLKSAARKNGLGWLRIDDALKEVITERIRLTNRMMAQMRFSYMPEMCDTLVSALCTAIWNPKEITVDERLDDGTSDIDTLDAFEYTIERYIKKFIRYE